MSFTAMVLQLCLANLARPASTQFWPWGDVSISPYAIRGCTSVHERNTVISSFGVLSWRMINRSEQPRHAPEMCGFDVKCLRGA